MRILIAGGSSTIGNALKAVLSGSHEVLTAGRKNCDIKLDLNDPAGSMILPSGLDAVIHTAAHFGGKTGQAIADAENTNVIGTLKLCQAAVTAKAGHFIFISSIFSTLKPTADNYGIYALSKKHAEEVASLFCAAESLPLTILRPSQVYGNAKGFEVHQPFFYMMMDKAANGQDITLYGSNDPHKNYIHIDDLTRIISAVIEKRVEGAYHCTNMADVTYSQIAKAAFAAFNKGGNVFFLKDKPDIPDNIFEKSNTLYEKIGFYPRIPIEEGIIKLSQHRSSLT